MAKKQKTDCLEIITIIAFTVIIMISAIGNAVQYKNYGDLKTDYVILENRYQHLEKRANHALDCAEKKYTTIEWCRANWLKVK